MILKFTTQVLERLKDDLVMEFKSQMDQNDLNATGKLKDSIGGVVKKSPNLLTLNVFAKPYFQYVDDGRGQGKMPPLEKIMKWVQAKGLGKSSNIKSKRVNRLRDVAWSIAKVIGEKGTIERFNYGGAKIISFVDQKYRNIITQEITKSYLKDLENQIETN